MALKAARDTSGMTQAQVAEKAKLGERLYQDYEYGKREPGVRTAIRIADVLGILDLREIFSLSGAATPDTAKEPGGNQAQATSKA